MSDWSSSPSESVLQRREDAARRRRRRRQRIAASLAIATCIAAVCAAVATSGFSQGSSHPAATRPVAAVKPRLPAVRPPTQAQRADAAIDRVLRHNDFILQGGPKREVALTFDDGPGPYTPDVVRVLAETHAAATFFQVGRMIPVFHAAGRLEAAHHFVIGDHTQNHPPLAELGAGLQTNEIEQQMASMRADGEPRPRLFRPPYRSFNHTTIAIMRRLSMLMVLWSVDSEDYRLPGVPAIVDRVLREVRPGGIVLLHDAGGPRLETVEALPLIIRALRARHYELVTVPQLLESDPPRAHSQQIPSSAAGAG